MTHTDEQALTIHEVPATAGEWPIRVGSRYQSRGCKNIHVVVTAISDNPDDLWPVKFDNWYEGEATAYGTDHASMIGFRKLHKPIQSATLPKHLELLARAYCALDAERFPELRGEIFEILKPLTLGERLRVSVERDGVISEVK